MSETANKTAETGASATSGVRARVGGQREGPSFPGDSVRVGRYLVGDCIAAGGMATVHIGRLRGAAGFSRTVAIKRLLPHFAKDPEFESLFVHEARLVGRIQHPNVVATLDVVAEDGELILVMDYVAGETLARLMQAAGAESGEVPQRILLSIIRDALCGLHAAHEARDRHGAPLDIVHRDISPQNLMVGSDGVTRVLDFGIAKAASSVEVTRQGLVRGKAAYMAPEQIYAEQVTRRADIYAVGVVLWEILVGERLFPGGVRPELLGDTRPIASPRARGARIDAALDAIVMRALATAESERFETAQAMAEQISAFELAPREEVAAWVQATAHEGLNERAALVARVESADASLLPPPSAARRSELGFGEASEATLAQAQTPATEQARPRSSRSRPLTWALVAAACASIAVGVITARGGSSPAASPGPLAPPVSVPLAAPTSPPAATSAAPLEKNADVPLNIESGSRGPHSPTAVPEAAQSGPAPALSAARTGARGTRKARSRRAAARSSTKAAKKSDCTPPYTIDAAGRRHYKVQCF